MPVANRMSELTPYWKSECGRATVYVGDNLQVMKKMPPDQFHAVVTDPPYGLEFMGEEWDAPWRGGVEAKQRRAGEMSDPVKAQYLRHNVEYVRDGKLYQDWFEARCAMMLRVARPGALLLSFGGTRMWHRMACAIEDAGFEIRDCLMWLYGKGMPKGTDIAMGIDKLRGNKRAVVSEDTDRRGDGTVYGIGHSGQIRSGAPISDAAAKWQGWNTALKPAWEPIILAQKQPAGSYAQNTLKYGCGGMNVDACRVGTTGADVEKYVESKMGSGSGIYEFNRGDGQSMSGGFVKTQKDGRWPANVVVDDSEEVATLLTQEVARFFYSAKAGDSDRPHGKGNGKPTHPTVKPLDLMRYLVRLVCVRGGVVLDPFTGSGSTGCAAIAEGMDFVGIERPPDKDQQYADIAVGRLKLALGGGSGQALPPKKIGGLR